MSSHNSTFSSTTSRQTTGWSNIAFRRAIARQPAHQSAARARPLLPAQRVRKNDFDCEILLGYGMQRLHETPVLPRDAIRTALGSATPPHVVGDILPIGPLAAADLADQVEQIKIAPQSMNTEEVSKLWTALQAHYRPTATYHISVVLIEDSQARKVAAAGDRRNHFRASIPSAIHRGNYAADCACAVSRSPFAGHNFKAPQTKLNSGFPSGSIRPALTDTEIVVTLPTDCRRNQQRADRAAASISALLPIPIVALSRTSRPSSLRHRSRLRRRSA